MGKSNMLSTQATAESMAVTVRARAETELLRLEVVTVGADIKNTPFLNLTAERPCLPGVKTNKEVR